MGDLFPSFRGTEESLSVLASAVSKVTYLEESVHHTKVTHFGVACPWPLLGKEGENVGHVGRELKVGESGQRMCRNPFY